MRMHPDESGDYKNNMNEAKNSWQQHQILRLGDVANRRRQLISPNAFTSSLALIESLQNAIRPEFIRLPKPSKLCPYTGLSRSKMNELVLPSEQNNCKPPVASISLRKRGQVKAVRLVVYDSLIAYLRSFLDEAGGRSA